MSDWRSQVSRALRNSTLKSLRGVGCRPCVSINFCLRLSLFVNLYELITISRNMIDTWINYWKLGYDCRWLNSRRRRNATRLIRLQLIQIVQDSCRLSQTVADCRRLSSHRWTVSSRRRQWCELDIIYNINRSTLDVDLGWKVVLQSVVCHLY